MAQSFELSATIGASGMQVLFAFLEVGALRSWWKARNAIVEPRPGGLFVVEWKPGTRGEDEFLGPLDGVLVGVLDRSMSGHFVHWGDLHWLSPKGETFGPTRLEVDVFSKGDPRRKPTVVRIRGSAFQEGERWQHYLDMTRRTWESAITELKIYCENEVPEHVEEHVAPLGGTYLAEAVLRDRRIS